MENEDLLEMLNAGLIKIAIVDSHKANFWKPIFKYVQFHPNVALRGAAQIGWTIREAEQKIP